MTKTTPRLYVNAALAAGAEVALAPEQAHYLANVLRLAAGAAVLAFNGSDGEWEAVLVPAGKKKAALAIVRQSLPPAPPPDIDYVFAPIKHARLDYMVQKATELGARRLRPVITRRTIAERVNLERMMANAVEAAEQCNLVFVPEVLAPVKLQQLLADWDHQRRLIFCDEQAAGKNPLTTLSTITLPAALLVGPEGGFAPEERQLLLAQSFVTPISLGPRILRADTAASAALALLQAVVGDWSGEKL
jgi:16S rRNA (uracil1498-N3)-methyltransferase